MATNKLRVLDLFSGIGGFSLGLEATGGFEAVAFCEIDSFCQKVLAKHWPSVPIAGDIKLLRGEHVRERCGPVDVVCGGFPCQDISLAGKGAGLSGARSGLWSEFHRLLEEIHPRWALIENVSALRSRGLDQVLGSLAEIGYDAEWHCIPASAVGAPHRRDRVWIIAYPNSDGERQPIRPQSNGATHEPGLGTSFGHDADGFRDTLADTASSRSLSGAQPGIHCGETSAGPRDEESQRLHRTPATLSDPLREQLWQQSGRRSGEDGAGAPQLAEHGEDGYVADANSGDEHGRSGFVQMGRFRREGEIADYGDAARTQWSAEPNVGRVAHGVPSRVDRLRALGNSLVPAIPYILGRAILAAVDA